jgi:hypothetical protein
MEGSVLSFLKAERKVSDTGSAQCWASSFSSKVEKWLMMTFVMENCLLDLFVVFDLDLEPMWIDNSCLLVCLFLYLKSLS